MRRMSLVLAAACGAAALALAALTLIAGPLDPPSGQVASTYKTLSEVEPRTAISAANTPGDADSLFRITQPGSYYLTGNVAGEPGKSGIEIATSNGVTIDLMGFSMLGGAGSLDGVTTSGVQGTITIRNGTVGGWGDDGIDLSPTSSGEGHVVEHVIASGNTDRGINTGDLSIVRGCEALNTLSDAGAAISVGFDSIVEQCSAHNNSSHGIIADPGSAILGCVSNDNARCGIIAGSRCTIAECAAGSNGAFGISASSFSTITASTVSGNSSSGIDTDSNCSLTACNASGNGGNGFQLNGGCTVTACTASDNALNGFFARHGTRLSECTGASNDNNGFFVEAATVERCTARANASDGIEASEDCRIVGNTCEANGPGAAGAGINITGSASRIEGNLCLDNAFGIAVGSTVNLVFGNTARANTVNYAIVSGNRVGTIVVPPVSGNISGNSGAAGFGSSDPWANIAY